MITIPDTVTLTDNKEKSRFEWRIDQLLAVVEYKSLGNGVIALTHTEVDPALEGKGVAGKLVKAILDRFSQEDLHFRPYCSYVQTYLAKHPEYKVVLDPSFKY